jgi:glutamate-1-semialdehyde 2,1-aminomutase
MGHRQSQTLFAKSQTLIPGGVNSPVRACRSVGCDPLFIHSADGPYIFDADGHRYLDYVLSWGPMILGHRHPAVVQAIDKVMERGTSFGAPTDLEVELAEMVVEALPSMEMVRMVNSGTEATMSAIRLARAITGRDTIVKFDGCYHGHADTLLVAAGSGVATLGIAGSPGIPQALVELTLSLPYNDVDAFAAVMAQKGERIAAVIVEPVAGNMGLVRPKPEFLQALRHWTHQAGSLLIFDEVMTGFRVAYGGAQVLYGIRPDITTLGKIIGGGLPVGAYGGSYDIMAHVAPQGSVYQAGTLSGNPLAMAAGIATLRRLKTPGFYEALDQASGRLAQGLAEAAARAGIPATVDRVGSMLGMFFTDRPVVDFASAKTADTERFGLFYRSMLAKGIYLAPSPFEALFVSAAHSADHIEQTIAAAAEALAERAAA